MLFATICNLPARCHLHSCLLHICLSQTFYSAYKTQSNCIKYLDAKSHLICLNPKLPNSDCYEDTETHHMDVRLFVSIKPSPN